MPLTATERLRIINRDAHSSGLPSCQDPRPHQCSNVFTAAFVNHIEAVTGQPYDFSKPPRHYRQYEPAITEYIFDQLPPSVSDHVFRQHQLIQRCANQTATEPDVTQLEQDAYPSPFTDHALESNLSFQIDTLPRPKSSRRLRKQAVKHHVHHTLTRRTFTYLQEHPDLDSSTEDPIFRFYHRRFYHDQQRLQEAGIQPNVDNPFNTISICRNAHIGFRFRFPEPQTSIPGIHPDMIPVSSQYHDWKLSHQPDTPDPYQAMMANRTQLLSNSHLYHQYADDMLLNTVAYLNTLSLSAQNY